MTPEARSQRGSNHAYTRSGCFLPVSRSTQPIAFANEEFPFVEHTVRIAAEPFKVSCAATQLGKQRQERRAANPEVVIDRPSVEDVEQPRRAFHQWARDRDGQFVDEGPRLRLPDQALEQRDVAPTEERFEGIKQKDGHHSPLKQRPAPEPRRELDEFLPIELTMLLRDRPHDRPHHR